MLFPCLARHLEEFRLVMSFSIYWGYSKIALPKMFYSSRRTMMGVLRKTALERERKRPLTRESRNAEQ